MVIGTIASFAFPPLAIWLLNKLSRVSSVTGPAKELQNQISEKERALDSEKQRIDQEFRPRESQIQAELDRLNSYKAMCTVASM